MPLLGAFLRLGRHIVSVNRLTLPVGLRPKVGAVVAPGAGGFLLFLLHLLVDALQDEQQHPQRPGHRHDDKDGDGGNLCKIMFSRLHETEFLSQKDKNKTTFHSIIAERGLFVKGVFLCVKNLLHQAAHGLGVSGGVVHRQALDELGLCV